MIHHMTAGIRSAIRELAETSSQSDAYKLVWYETGKIPWRFSSDQGEEVMLRRFQNREVIFKPGDENVADEYEVADVYRNTIIDVTESWWRPTEGENWRLILDVTSSKGSPSHSQFPCTAMIQSIFSHFDREFIEVSLEANDEA